MDEVAELYKFLQTIKSPKLENKIMIDVGACMGTAFKEYLSGGWKIHAFEPNQVLYKKLVEKYGKTPKIKLNNVCVGEVKETGRKFYLSAESIGISSLCGFHSTHQEASFKVDVVRLDDYLKENKIQQIDFLKIDTEGYDFFVLKSMPWGISTLKPTYIICEFEDRKTEDKLGYKWSDMADYLVNLGYWIVVSEWKPIVKYGIKHTWNKYKRYPCQLDSRDAWGKLICFSQKLDYDRYVKLVAKL